MEDIIPPIMENAIINSLNQRNFGYLEAITPRATAIMSPVSITAAWTESPNNNTGT